MKANQHVCAICQPNIINYLAYEPRLDEANIEALLLSVTSLGFAGGPRILRPAPSMLKPSPEDGGLRV